MFGSTILEVIIGVVFIYVLLSLLATTVNELIQTFIFSARGRDLEKAIVAMLSDRKPTAESPVKTNNPDAAAGRKTDLAELFYTHPLVMKFAKQGKNNRPSYISRTTFSKVLIDLLSEPGKAHTTMAEVKAVIEKLPEDDQTRKLLLSFIRDAGEDMHALRASLEHWYDEMMDRASGWYKRRVQKALLVIGFSISALLNADTFNIARTLTNDPVARERIVRQAEAYRDRRIKERDSLAKQVDSLRPTVEPAKTKDSAANSALAQTTSRVDSLNQQINSLREQINFLRQEEIAEATTIVGMGWDHPTVPPWNGSDGFLKSLGRKLWYILFRIPGWSITALAITMGAPFWFDILNKVINIRNAGLKPEEKKNPVAPQPTAPARPVV